MNLDNLEKIKKLDKSNVLGSVNALADQCLHAFEDVENLKLPNYYQNINTLVMTGMGGSGLGARVIESVFGNRLKVPLVRVNNYTLPSFVGPKTLVVCSSYSGNTEETVQNLKTALNKKAKILTIFSGGKLEKLSKKYKIPHYKIDPKFNPSNQPRMAIGYSIVGQLALVSKTSLLDLTKEEIRNFVKVMKNTQEKCNFIIPSSKNPAKELAKKFHDKIINLVAAEHLTGAIHVFKNQINENSKAFAIRFDIPELNHHLMEGLKDPDTNKKELVFFLAQSDLYGKRNQKRIKVTTDVIGKNNVKTILWKAKSKTKLSQVFELIQFGAYINFYLAMLYETNPAPVKWVDYFKKQMKK